MDNDELEARMRALEYFHSLRVLPGVWVVIRVDGRGFSRFTDGRYRKPFDLAFHDAMLQTAQAMLKGLAGLYAYTESDEISLLFPPDWNLFDREVEKLVSISAGLASSTFTLATQQAVHFDSRIWMSAHPEEVVDYFRWRQADAARCALNGWCYWTLRSDGKSVGQATSALRGKPVAYKHELLFQHGINFNDLPTWQRRGVGLRWETYKKVGYNPIAHKEVVATRRRIKVDEALPMKDEYGAYMREMMQGKTTL